MRFLAIFILGSALAVGCADDGSGEGGAGGSGGGAGGEGGAAGEGGSGGGGGTDTSRAYLFVSPVPPCEAGSESVYSAETVVVGPGTLDASFPNCAQVPSGRGTTVMCPKEVDAVDYQAILTDAVPNDVQANGQFEACSGFLFREVTPAADEVIVDVFISPAPPCEQGVPSDYRVEVFVDGAPDPVVVTGDFADCTGDIDSQDSTITCSNDQATLPYSITIGEGLDWQVSIDGNWETCAASLVR